MNSSVLRGLVPSSEPSFAVQVMYYDLYGCSYYIRSVDILRRSHVFIENAQKLAHSHVEFQNFTGRTSEYPASRGGRGICLFLISSLGTPVKTTLSHNRC